MLDYGQWGAPVPYLILQASTVQELERKVCEAMVRGAQVPIGGLSAVKVAEPTAQDDGMLYSQAMVAISRQVTQP